ncbi:hypothetical protein RhiLY_10192 [Ceratobasidium sp. AG-Ba]|nr:hypothetical protein RhiLY_10192 [Ceratobasidium sp. AG-Ba]
MRAKSPVRAATLHVAIHVLTSVLRPFRHLVALSLRHPAAPPLNRSSAPLLCRANSTALKLNRPRTRPPPKSTAPIEKSLAARLTSNPHARPYVGRLHSGAMTLAPKTLYSHARRDPLAMYPSTHW